MSIADRTRDWRQTVETNCKNESCQLNRAAARRAWITVVLQGLSFSSCVTLLSLEFDTPVSWARRFSDFFGVCSSLAPVSCNFSSVITRHICFCFLSVKSPVDVSSQNCELSVCWKFFSSRNLHRNFCQPL
jgi:hypothetical protein